MTREEEKKSNSVLCQKPLHPPPPEKSKKQRDNTKRHQFQFTSPQPTQYPQLSCNKKDTNLKM